MLIVVVLLWRATAPSGQLIGLRGDAFSTLGYVANWHFIWTGQGYFAQTAAPSPLLHMWSLAVEEQFYLVWPLLLWLLLRWRAGLAGTRLVRTVAIAGALAATLSTAIQAMAGANVNRLYYGTDTRAAMLLTGAALATVLPLNGVRVRTSRLLPMVGAASLAGLVVLVMTVNGQSGWLYRGGFLLVAVLTAGVLAGAVGAPEGPLAVGAERVAASLAGPHFVRRLSLALAGRAVPHARPHRPQRLATARDSGTRHDRAGHGLMVPRRGSGTPVLAVGRPSPQRSAGVAGEWRDGQRGGGRRRRCRRVDVSGGYGDGHRGVAARDRARHGQ